LPFQQLSICTSCESATQFAIYKSVCNIDATVGSLFDGAVSDVTNWSQGYARMGLILFLLLAIFRYRAGGIPSEYWSPRARGGGTYGISTAPEGDLISQYHLICRAT